MPFMFTFPEHTDLKQQVDITRPLMVNRCVLVLEYEFDS